jgi:hypothetical protein
MTKAQRAELQWLSECIRGGSSVDSTYVYPLRHFEALERLGYVAIESKHLRSCYVKITDAGREALR